MQYNKKIFARDESFKLMYSKWRHTEHLRILDRNFNTKFFSTHWEMLQGTLLVRFIRIFIKPKIISAFQYVPLFFQLIKRKYYRRQCNNLCIEKQITDHIYKKIFPFIRKCSIKLSKVIFRLSRQNTSVNRRIGSDEFSESVGPSVFRGVPWNEAYAWSKRSLGSRFFFHQSGKSLCLAFSTNRSSKSRWNVNEMSFKPEEGSVKLEGPPASFEETDEWESERARAVMNSNTPFGERTPLAKRKLPENGNSHGITRFLNIPRRRLPDSSSG